jgi:hypothetical protein
MDATTVYFSPAVFYLAVEANALYWSGGYDPSGAYSIPPPISVVVRVPK